MRKGTQAFEVLHVDLVDINPPAYNGNKWVIHTVCDKSQFHFTITGKTKKIMTEGIKLVVKTISKFAKGTLAVCAVHSDEDTVLESNDFHSWMHDNGIVLILSEPYAHEHNGKAEVAGRI